MKHLGKLRRPLLGALLLLSLAGVGTLWSTNLRTQAVRENNAARQGKAAIQQELERMRAEAAGIEERTNTFRRLQDSGVIGEEARRQWTETLAAFEQARQTQTFVHELGEKMLRNELSSPHLSVFASRLNLQLEVRHETDFLGLLSRLANALQALTIVRHCQLERQATPENGLAARCEIELITFVPHNAKP